MKAKEAFELAEAKSYKLIMDKIEKEVSRGGAYISWRGVMPKGVKKTLERDGYEVRDYDYSHLIKWG